MSRKMIYGITTVVFVVAVGYVWFLIHELSLASHVCTTRAINVVSAEYISGKSLIVTDDGSVFSSDKKTFETFSNDGLGRYVCDVETNLSAKVETVSNCRR
ncbi:hypothetical protein HGB24_03480 [Candidatus Saccharibacteria bacterium]|nr:hypothetical protein [Candidatus Saccharibacteria bacterium]